ncbi:substrate-binding domain-containing protein [Leucobacter chromiireducens]|uniref:Sugar ABC transporter substrate-binding protein n=2 Tax=Leucobacter TaxID=55968 RepID=A0ABS1SDM6_9MICO|nr:substrate-binding domain-containing protein [Leucobacter chromiireducens]MBL3678642.1 sugar ABC transporter substrate-binding protein [Leucobacter chromiireducens subsp. solipictus]
MMRKTTTAALGAAAILALGLAGCTQGAPAESAGAGSSESGKVAEASAPAPAPFDQDGVKIAIVQQSGQGDYFQQYLNGTRQQADALGVELSVFDAQGDNATQATQLDQAIASGVSGIIVRHGLPDTLCAGVNKAIDAGIVVAVYDVEIQQCAPESVQTQQSDALMASLVLDQMAKDIGTDAQVGYVNYDGIAPLDRRDVVWQQYVKDQGWDQKFKTGNFTNSSATDSAPMVTAAVQANAEITAIYSPYDEFAKGTLTGLDQVPGTEDILVYGADISTADIELMTAEGSRWTATGATDPNAIGAAVMRTLALQMAGELEKSTVEFPPVLVTQEMLREKKITNMDDLRAAQPELNISEVSGSDWIPVVSF